MPSNPHCTYTYDHCVFAPDETSKHLYSVEILENRWVLAILVSGSCGVECAEFVFETYPAKVRSRLVNKPQTKGVHFQNILEYEMKVVAQEWDSRCLFDSKRLGLLNDSNERDSTFDLLDISQYTARGFASGASIGSALVDLHTGKIIGCSLGDTACCICLKAGCTITEDRCLDATRYEQGYAHRAFPPVKVDEHDMLAGQCAATHGIGFNSRELAGVIDRTPSAFTYIRHKKDGPIEVLLGTRNFWKQYRGQAPAVLSAAFEHVPLQELMAIAHKSHGGSSALVRLTIRSA